jgi:hypothetical protein
MSIFDPPKIMRLEEVGTRYDHYMELKEIFADGVEIVKGALSIHSTVADRARLISLQNAVQEIENRLEVLSGYREKMTRWGTLGTTIDAIPVHKDGLLSTQIPEGSNVKPEVKPNYPNPFRNRKDSQGPPDFAGTT